MMISEDFFFPDFAKSPSTKLYCWTNDFFRLRFNSFSLYGFATDSSWKQPPFYTNGIRTVRNIAHFFSPPAPYAISTVDGSIFCTFEGLTRGRTSFYLSQYMHNLWLLLTKLYITQFSSLTDMFHKIWYKVFSLKLVILALAWTFLWLKTFPSINFYQKN